MDFIERLLGLSPDAGSGATEWMLFAVPFAIIALLVLRRARNRT
jgi:hypothetical protein